MRIVKILQRQCSGKYANGIIGLNAQSVFDVKDGPLTNSDSGNA
jgi:hypothetical protein